ncbi:MAG: hypothetical protein ACRDP6_14770 [Actinoallomurus sp.]
MIHSTAGGPYCGVCGAPIDVVPIPAHPGDPTTTYGSCPNGCDPIVLSRGSSPHTTP